MCGLAGFWQRDGQPADPRILTAMLDRQQHRGPDDRGIWTAGSIGLGLDRLSILDLSAHGHQPFAMPDGTSVLAYNGEVYNWRELRGELEREGVRFASRCDTEVVLHALHRWGPRVAIPRFNGMFALAWYDQREGVLWLARDRSGIKPLFVAEQGFLLAFASEAKALFAHPDISCRPDLHSLVTHVWMERMVGDWTGFEGVRTVEPGTMLRYDTSHREDVIWFDLERDLDVERIVRSSRRPFAEHVKEFRSLMEQSVAAHLQSDAPLAVMCSGGLDSSLTTAIAVRHKPDLVAYVAEAEGLEVSEADKAQVVADHLGVQLRRVRLSDAEFPDVWARAAGYHDQPIYFKQNPLALKVCEAVRDDGFKVILTGEGSDELFGGYDWQTEVGEMWKRRQRHARLVRNIAPLRALGRWVRWLAPFDLEALAEDPFHHRGGRPTPAAAELVLDGGIRARRAARLFALLAPLPAEDRGFLARAYDDWYHHLRVLLHANDNMSMGASVEARVPFLENGLIDFGLHLAPEAKRHRGVTKRVVKAAAEDLLPRDIVHAKKIGFGMPQQFLTGYAALLDGGLVQEWFKWGRRERPHLDRVLEQKAGLTGKLVSLELWAQIHFNGQHPSQLAERMRAARR
jgi:asparagine synthase (glutamine-hydrolysing)